MMLAKVLGNVVATVKAPQLEGVKLLLIQPVTREGKPRGRPLVALDAIGAGFHETVYWCRGRESALAFAREVPCDASIVGIVDAITTGANPNPAPPASAPVKKAARNPRGKR